MPQIIVTFDLPFRQKVEPGSYDEHEYIELCREFVYEACLAHGIEVKHQELEDYLEDKRNGW